MNNSVNNEFEMVMKISNIDWRQDIEDIDDDITEIMEDPRYYDFDLNKNADELKELGLDDEQIINFLQVLLYHTMCV